MNPTFIIEIGPILDQFTLGDLATFDLERLEEICNTFHWLLEDMIPSVPGVKLNGKDARGEVRKVSTWFEFCLITGGKEYRVHLKFYGDEKLLHIYDQEKYMLAQWYQDKLHRVDSDGIFLVVNGIRKEVMGFGLIPRNR